KVNLTNNPQSDTNKSLLKLTKNLTTIKNKKATALTKPKQNQQQITQTTKTQQIGPTTNNSTHTNKHTQTNNTT
ncbi:MAG: hypothetical protein QM571_07705, partial [Micrococcaceae bacterium]